MFLYITVWDQAYNWVPIRSSSPIWSKKWSGLDRFWVIFESELFGRPWHPRLQVLHYASTKLIFLESCVCFWVVFRLSGKYLSQHPTWWSIKIDLDWHQSWPDLLQMEPHQDRLLIVFYILGTHACMFCTTLPQNYCFSVFCLFRYSFSTTERQKITLHSLGNPSNRSNIDIQSTSDLADGAHHDWLWRIARKVSTPISYCISVTPAELTVRLVSGRISSKQTKILAGSTTSDWLSQLMKRAEVCIQPMCGFRNWWMRKL